MSENTSFWQLKRLVTLSTYRRYTNNYLSIYLSSLCSRLYVSVTESVGDTVRGRHHLDQQTFERGHV